MARSRTAGSLLAVATLWLCLARASAASDDTFVIVVRRDNPISAVDREFLKDAFLKKVSRWKHGGPLRPIDLSPDFSARERFVRDVIGKTPSQLRSYWAQRIFSGTALPPPIAESPAAAVAYVMATPGAVAYVPSATNTGAVKVVSFE